MSHIRWACALTVAGAPAGLGLPHTADPGSLPQARFAPFSRPNP